MKRKRVQKKVNTALVAWKQKILEVIPVEFTARFDKVERILHVTTKDGFCHMALEWVSGYRDSVYINTLSVARKARNQGLGKSMLDIAETICRAAGRRNLTVFDRLTDKQIQWLSTQGFYDTAIEFVDDWQDSWFIDDSWQDMITAEICMVKHIN